jgi:CRP-like cAMP-binding protein
MARQTIDAALRLYLDRLLLRSRLSAEQRRAILELPAHRVNVDVRRDFVAVGDKVDHACLIVEGLVARFAQTRDGNRSIVAFHIPGDMADLHSVVAPHVTWALHALAPSVIVRVPHAGLIDLAERHPDIAIAFWRDCVADANILAQWTVNIARKDAVARVAHLMCEMSLRYQAVGLAGPQSFPFPITQGNLADAVGLTPVHLNRVLRRLKEDGAAAKEPAGMSILGFARLAALGEFDEAYLQLARADQA